MADPDDRNGRSATQGTSAQSDDLYHLLVEHVRDYAIFLLDPQGYVLTWNEGAQRIKGYRAREIIGQHFSRFYPPDAVQRGTPQHGLRVAAAEGRWEDENWRVRKDGSRFWANVVLTALHADDGTLVGYAKVTRDLTERKRAEEDRLRLVAREQQARAEATMAQALVRAQDEFLAVAAHELKTPIAGVKLATQLLLRRAAQRRGTDPDQLRHMLRTIDEQIDRLGRLAGLLLETARLRTDELTLDLAPTDVTALARAAVTAAQARTERHVVVLCAEKDEEAIWAAVDAPRLEQVLTNLLDNALKYSPAGGQIDVQVRRPTPQRLEVAVRDRGIGVPEEHRSHLFERFYRVHAATHQSGLGLGLYISREIVARHGGEIVAEFPPDGGTRMVVRLPLQPPLDAANPGAPAGLAASADRVHPTGADLRDAGV